MNGWNKEKIENITLAGKCNINFGKEKYCIGYNNGEMMHPCAIHAVGSRQCKACAAKDISRLYTRLDHRGFERFYEEFRRQTFSIYLVSIGYLVKCGVTRSSRLMERMREQGADYFCEIARINDAETAYTTEQLIQVHFLIRNSITNAQKMKLIGCANPEKINTLVSNIEKNGILSDYKTKMTVQKLEYSLPPSFSEAENISGKIIGTKGQILFFENEGINYAINMSKKVGMHCDILNV